MSLDREICHMKQVIRSFSPLEVIKLALWVGYNIFLRFKIWELFPSNIKESENMNLIKQEKKIFFEA